MGWKARTFNKLETWLTCSIFVVATALVVILVVLKFEQRKTIKTVEALETWVRFVRRQGAPDEWIQEQMLTAFKIHDTAQQDIVFMPFYK